jgi:hypothetical protein
MLPHEVLELAELIYPGFSELNPKDEVVYDHYLSMAIRVWNAGWRKDTDATS